MNKIHALAMATVGACMIAAPSISDARSSFGFSINTAPAYYYPPAPVYVAPPPPPPPPPVYYRPAYYYPSYYHRPATGFSFSYHGR